MEYFDFQLVGDASMKDLLEDVDNACEHEETNKIGSVNHSRQHEERLESLFLEHPAQHRSRCSR